MLTSDPRTVSLDADSLLAQDQRTDAESITAALQACALIGRAHRAVCDGQLWAARIGLEPGALPSLHVQLIRDATSPPAFPERPRQLRLWVDTGSVIWRFEVRCLEELSPGRWRVSRPTVVEAER